MIPYERGLETNCESGESNCVTLIAPTRGVLTRITVKQTSGTLDGYTYTIYNRLDACSGATNMDSNDEDGVIPMDPELYQIAETQTVSAAAAVGALYQQVVVYENRDEQDATNRRPTGALYVAITPAGSGAKDFQISYAISAPGLQ